MIRRFKKRCKVHGITNHIHDSSNHNRCLKCRSAAVSKRRQKVKQMLVEYFGGKCSIRGYDKCIAALEFHHKDRSKKEFALSVQGVTRSYKVALKEASKCQLVCANCHRELENMIPR